MTNNAQFTLTEFFGMIRRRRAFFIAPLVIVTVVATLAAFMLPKEYVSSTTILHQEKWVLNPLVKHTMVADMEARDQMTDFSEIIHSTPVIEALIDSLDMKSAARSPVTERRLIKIISSRIKTVRNSYDSFTLSYYSRSPKTAEKAVRILSELYMETRSRVNNSKNDFAVQFYGQKLNNLRNKFERSQRLLVSDLKQHKSALPVTDRELYSQIGDYNKRINNLRNTVANYEQALSILRKALEEGKNNLDLKSLYEVPLLGVPNAPQIQSALQGYDQLLHEYTSRYPGVADSLSNLMQLLGRTREVVISDIGKKEAEIWNLEKQRNKTIATIKQATVANSRDQDLESNFNIYKGLYQDMKIKLEQALTSRDLGDSGTKQFVVLDPPYLPLVPAKPRKFLMIAGGFSIGLLLGVLAAGLAEMIDSRINASMDVDTYGKPVIAYLPIEDSYDKRAE